MLVATAFEVQHSEVTAGVYDLTPSLSVELRNCVYAYDPGFVRNRQAKRGPCSEISGGRVKSGYGTLGLHPQMAETEGESARLHGAL